jgi:agmatine deiminase
VQFSYKPDYLKSKAELATITDVERVCSELGINPRKSPLVIDGGNVVCSRNKAIMCDKVFKENPSYSKEAITGMLQEAFELEDIIFIPTHPEDWTGHADGLVRFFG